MPVSLASATAALDEASAAMIRPGISMAVASCDARHATSLARGYACRVAPGRRRVTMFLAASQSETMLAHLRATRRIAVAFSEIDTNRTLQLKGEDAEVQPLQADDADWVQAYCEAFIAKTGEQGYPETLMRAYMRVEPTDLVAVTFTPGTAFTATPGPEAGQRLGDRR